MERREEKEGLSGEAQTQAGNMTILAGIGRATDMGEGEPIPVGPNTEP